MRNRTDPLLTLQMIPWPEQEARNLERAAAILEVRGHCRGQFEDRRGRVCAVRAYEMACTRRGYGLAAMSIVLGTALSVADWNDASGRSKRDVIAAFHRTARELRKIAAGNEP